jgi:hypothetical protein
MRHTSLVTTVLLAGALAFGAAPTFAQRGGGGGSHMGGGGGGHMGGGGGGHMGGGGGHVGGGHVSGAPSGGGMRGGGQVFAPGAGVPRGTAGVHGGAFNSSGAFNHGSFGPHSYGGGRWWGGRYWNVAPLHFYHPYYAFHPYFSLGFGLWAGYPVDWAYPYYYPPYPYYPNYPYYPYPYAPSGSGESVTPPVESTQPDQSSLGGMSFEITPSDAQVFIDGNYVGTVGEFTPTTQPLGVRSGRHRVEIRSDGYKTMSFDVDIVAGQVIPYQGQMER